MSKDISKRMTHDRFFKINMGHLQVAKDTLVELLPPSTLKMLKLDTLAMGPTEKIHAISQKQSLADIVYEVKLTNNDPGYVYIHIEAQSSPDETMPLRMMEMMTALQRYHVENSKKKLPLPIVIPLIIYSGSENYRFSTNWLDCFDPSMRSLAEKIMVEPLPLFNLNDIADPELAKHAHAALMYYALKNVHQKSWQDLLQGIAEMLHNLRNSQQNIDNSRLSTVFEAVLKYVVDNCGDVPPIDELSGSLIRFADTLPDELGDKAMTPREVFIQEGIRIGNELGVEIGREEGRQEGRQEGKQEGKQEGIQLGLQQAALGLIHQKMPNEIIAEATGLSLKAIEQLKHAANADEIVS